MWMLSGYSSSFVKRSRTVSKWAIQLKEPTGSGVVLGHLLKRRGCSRSTEAVRSVERTVRQFESAGTAPIDAFVTARYPIFPHVYIGLRQIR